MRRTFVSCTFALALVSTMLPGQEAKQPSTERSTQQSAAKDSGASGAQTRAAQAKKTYHRAARKQYSKAGKGAKRPAYRPEYTENSVEVINGASTKKVVFQSDKGTSASESAKNVPTPLKVEVVNGTSTDTQYFYAGNAQTEAQQAGERNRPVVVAVLSSNTRFAGGNKHPVVTGITAAEAGDAKSAGGGGPKLATGIAPQPKRPDYQPDKY